MVKKHIGGCIFGIDYVWFTIKSKTARLIESELGNHFEKIRSRPEYKTNNPIMPGKCKTRTYFHYKNNEKIYLIHNCRLSNLSAILVIHDPSLEDLLETESILHNMSSVEKFHFCQSEFRFDITPSLETNAIEVQRFLIQQMHHKGARAAFFSGSLPRATFYINSRNCHVQIKNYIRPKDPKPEEEEIVRLEITADTYWLQDYLNLYVPSDFSDFNFSDLLECLVWLDLDLSGVSDYSLKIGDDGLWGERVKNEHHYLGASYVLIEHRKKNHLNYKNPYRLKEMLFKDSKHRNEINKLLKTAYNKWLKSFKDE